MTSVKLGGVPLTPPEDQWQRQIIAGPPGAKAYAGSR